MHVWKVFNVCSVISKSNEYMYVCNACISCNIHVYTKRELKLGAEEYMYGMHVMYVICM